MFLNVKKIKMKKGKGNHGGNFRLWAFEGFAKRGQTCIILQTSEAASDSRVTKF